MNKEDRQIEWNNDVGIYNGKKLFSILVFHQMLTYCYASTCTICR